MPGSDLADLITLAESTGGKVIAAGDTGQLQAVQNGGGMSLLADCLGYARLAEPVRFHASWEQAASLRLRDGDTTVLTTTTSTPASRAVTRSRCWTQLRPPTSPLPQAARTRC